MSDNKELNNFAGIIKATPDYETAVRLIKGFLNARSGIYSRETVLNVIGSVDERFSHWDADIKEEYTSKNVHGNTLYIGASIAKKLKSEEYEILLVARRK